MKRWERATMKKPEADLRELARAVDRVHRVDASIDHAWHELRRVSQRQLFTTGAAVGLGVAALATLAGKGKKTGDGRDPDRASSRRPIVGGLLATLSPWMVDVAFRYLSSRPTRAAADSARNRPETERRHSLQPVTQGDPQ
jgi:hypothetical protein